ncbi:MAG: hypothetical protein J7513_08360 [Solirubrobacteraceae bacterium]|nr:hypothetical protein [Solirubrobacteraceae bacterium]
MPLRKGHALLTGMLAATAIAAAPAAANAACPATETTKAFAKFGDTADYSLAPGGNFESSAGWTLTGGASFQSGNETSGITTGSKSLKLPLNATATSPAFCVDETNPYFRFVSRPDNAVAGYNAQVIYTVGGATKTYQFTSNADQSWGSGSWSPSKVSPLAVKIPLTGADATASVQLKFTSTGNQVALGVGLWGAFAGGSIGSTSIDSVMVDPYRRG